MKDLTKIKTWHCFFEQSGTFKNQFKKLGLNAFDYDILDDFGQTDFKEDLFAQIEKAYEGGESIFDKMGEEDAIIAFFPCVRFEDQIIMRFRGVAFDQKNKTDEEKLACSLKLHEELNAFYSLITKMAIVCIRKNIPLIIENPYSTQHYLTRYWPISPAVIDSSRHENGDYYEKPTQYWFFNCKPICNLIMDEARTLYEKRKVLDQRGATRSLISPEYARRFIREYLKKYDENDACQW